MEKSFKSVQKFEFTNDGITVIKTLGENGGKSSLELLDSLSELVEVIIKLSLLNIHDIICNLAEFFDSYLELLVDLSERVRESSTFGVTYPNVIKLLELENSTSEVHDILTSLKEAIKSYKQSVCGDLPLIVGLGFVIKVSIFELVADLNSKGKLLMSHLCVFTVNHGEDFRTTDLALALINDRIANLSNQNNKSGWSVVVLRILPD